MKLEGLTTSLPSLVRRRAPAKGFPNSYAVRTGGKSYDFVNPDTKMYGGREFRRVKLEGQSIYFPKSTINAMYEGDLPLEIIAHEFNHTYQYFYGTYFDEFDFWALDLDPGYFDAWIELKALNQNIQRSSWEVFITNQAKEQLIYQKLFFKYNEIIAQ